MKKYQINLTVNVKDENELKTLRAKLLKSASTSLTDFNIREQKDFFANYEYRTEVKK